MNSLGTLRHAMQQRLAAASFAPSRREATLLLSHVLGLREAQILAYPERVITPQEERQLESLMRRRLAGEPMAYLLGEREFYGRPFSVDSRVLIPRPETEHLVEAALMLDLPATPRIVDVGTGSGCIALTLALERPDARVVAIDRSMGALAVAQRNRRLLTADPGASDLTGRTTFIRADMADGIRGSGIDLLVSNPPYVDPADGPSLSPEVTVYEPASALFAADQGRAAISQLLDTAQRLRPGTMTLIEIGYGQADWLRAAIGDHPRLRLDRLIEDYAQIPRVAVIRAVGT